MGPGAAVIIIDIAGIRRPDSGGVKGGNGIDTVSGRKRSVVGQRGAVKKIDLSSPGPDPEVVGIAGVHRPDRGGQIGAQKPLGIDAANIDLAAMCTGGELPGVDGFDGPDLLPHVRTLTPVPAESGRDSNRKNHRKDKTADNQSFIACLLKNLALRANLR